LPRRCTDGSPRSWRSGQRRVEAFDALLDQPREWNFQRYPARPVLRHHHHREGEPGINSALLQRGEGTETTLTMDVESIEDTIEKIEREGRPGLAGEDARPSRHGLVLTCRDNEGNKFGLFTNDPNAPER
jgi:predicted enzyme related to lactoylglutathione lyase